jgi:hypothetical protein
MDRRTTTETVIFRHPFRLAGFDRAEAPGIYTVETEGEALDSLTVIGWRHISSTLRVRRGGTTEYVPVDPQELRQAKAYDQEPDSQDLR